MTTLYLTQGTGKGRTSWQAHINSLADAGLAGCDLTETKLLYRTGKDLVVDHNKTFVGSQTVLLASYGVLFPRKAYVGIGWAPDTPFIAEWDKTQNQLKAKLTAALFSLSACKNTQDFSMVVLKIQPKLKHDFVTATIAIVIEDTP